MIGKKYDNSIIRLARFVQSPQGFTQTIVRSANGHVIVRELFADIRRVRKVSGNRNFIRSVEFARRVGILYLLATAPFVKWQMGAGYID